MNFKQVKSVRIPEGSVRRITIGYSEVWRKKPDYPITYTVPFHFITKEANNIRLVPKEGTETFVTLEYSLDNVTWKPWGSTKTGTLTIPMKPNSELYLRGNNTHLGSDDWSGANRFESDGPVDSAGDISSLVDVTKMEPNTFTGLFFGFRNLKSAPRLNLPILPIKCYSNAFRETGITSVDLSLIHDADERGLGETFVDCVDLKSVIYPTDLTVGGWGTFFGTFQNTSITEAFDFNFKFKAYANSSFYRTFACTGITEVKINTKHWIGDRYEECFADSTNLSLVDFSSVESTDHVESNWLMNVSPTGKFIKKSTVDLPIGPGGIPKGWVVENV